ncbi:MAG: Asp-tRNA(Asn)/Glu-tRNA(Gln) amidotransferase subunit GatC [Patescibacteria group bacterium]
MPALTPQQVQQIAHLARLELTEEEKQRYAEQISAVLDYMQILNEVNTDDVAETCQVTGLEDVTREDEVVECDKETRQMLLDAFPEKKGNLLKVKGVFES